MSSPRQFMNLYRQCFQLHSTKFKPSCPLAIPRGSLISRGVLAITTRLYSYSLTTSPQPQPVAKSKEQLDPRLRYEDMYDRLLQVYTDIDGTVSVKDFQAVSGL